MKSERVLGPSRHWGLLSNWMFVGLVISCGGGTETAGSEGNSGNAGSPTAGGAGGGANVAVEARPDLPPPPDDSCRRFNIQYSAEACSSPCPPAPCGAAQSSELFRGLGDYWCGGLGARPCVSGFDCSLVGDEQLFGCLIWQACTNDLECAGGRCVIDAGQASGECGTARDSGNCFTQADGSKVCAAPG